MTNGSRRFPERKEQKMEATLRRVGRWLQPNETPEEAALLLASGLILAVNVFVLIYLIRAV